jgi:hypothetical protein
MNINCIEIDNLEIEHLPIPQSNAIGMNSQFALNHLSSSVSLETESSRIATNPHGMLNKQKRHKHRLSSFGTKLKNFFTVID